MSEPASPLLTPNSGDPDVDAAAMLIRDAGLPGQPPVPRSAIDTLLGDRFRVVGSRRATRSPYRSATAWCLLHSGRAKDALELAEREGRISLHRAAGKNTPADQSACYAILAEVYFFNGWLREAIACASSAKDYAREAGHEGRLFRAQGLLSAALAWSGEINRAAVIAREAREIGEPRGWTNDSAARPLLMAEILVLSRRADAAGIAGICETLERNGGRDVISRGVTRFCTLVLKSVEQDNRQIVATARLVTHGSDALLSPPCILSAVASMEAVAHTHLGEPGAALAALQVGGSSHDHSVCYPLLEATVYLQLKEFRKALEVTDHCVKQQPDHAVASLVSVQLRRALAYEGLGLSSRADVAYSNANHLAYECGLLSGTLGLSRAPLQVLFDRMAENEPEFAAKVTAALPTNYEYPDRPGPNFEPFQLTERESVMAGWLMTDLTLPEIAQELTVSINTVKSQVRSLYRKLQASSREEAVLRLERTGLYRPKVYGQSPG
ncbi:MAG TPA: LuxR C-terminal-related transcriptional regulator [Actinomycetaceae bacterium]|nr:LuxR C-terminal-related transcriptional regulator [Actinomycetaceae bacterium]